MKWNELLPFKDFNFRLGIAFGIYIATLLFGGVEFIHLWQIGKLWG